MTRHDEHLSRARGDVDSGSFGDLGRSRYDTHGAAAPPFHYGPAHTTSNFEHLDTKCTASGGVVGVSTTNTGEARHRGWRGLRVRPHRLR